MLFHFLSAVCFVLTSIHRQHSASSSLALVLDAQGQDTTYEVCLSPGCLADGAQVTLTKMLALAPPNVQVKPGVCCSLCGNGPVVLQGNKKIRKVSDQKLLELLFGDPLELSSQQQDVLQAFDTVQQAKQALETNDHAQAIDLYEEGIQLGFQPAMELESSRNNENNAEEAAPGLRWLIQARQGEARSKLAAKDAPGAVAAAQSACELSSNAYECLELLHEAYQTKGGDAEGELNTLRALFDLPEPSKLTNTQTNNRRILGFRLQKLERESGQ